MLVEEELELCFGEGGDGDGRWRGHGSQQREKGRGLCVKLAEWNMYAGVSVNCCAGLTEGMMSVSCEALGDKSWKLELCPPHAGITLVRNPAHHQLGLWNYRELSQQDARFRSVGNYIDIRWND